METKREKALMVIFEDLKFCHTDLNRLIAKYDAPNAWETTASTSLEQRHLPRGLVSFQQHLYICTPYSNSILTCNANGEIMKEQQSSLKAPFAVDIDEKSLKLCIADAINVTILNLKLEFLSSWKLPEEAPSWSSFRALKVDGGGLYLTIDGLFKIFLCNLQDGRILKQFGADSGYAPEGITVDDKYVYLCDCLNHRVQILTKENGIWDSRWGNGIASAEQGQFKYPSSIYDNFSDDLIYVGDRISVQLFRKDGVCVQRLGDIIYGKQMNQFKSVYGICVLDERLYVSDGGNKRIQIFKRAAQITS